MYPIEGLMDQHSAPLTPESRAVMQDGIRRCLMAMLGELEAVESGATVQLLATVHGLAEALGDTH